MERRAYTYRNSTIGYCLSGSGPQVVVCFHGYGEDASSFDFLERYAGKQFTFYAIDLPFHGQTQWNEGLDFSPQYLQDIVTGILRINRQSAIANPQYALLGFSLGGRIVLGLYQSNPMLFNKIVLLAPDGLKVNFWYWLATQNIAGNRLFAFTMKHPRWFFAFLKVLAKLKLVNASIFKFVKYYIGDKEVRQQLYNRWTVLRKITPQREKIRTFIRENKTQLRLVYGQHDRIILPSVGEKFRKGIEDYSTLTIIASGHQVLHDKHTEEIVWALSM